MKISYIGMKAQEVSIKPGTMKIVMQPDAEVLDEVVVTGMTKVDKRLFTGAADRLTAASVKLDGLPDISRGLEGRSAGVSVHPVPLVQLLKSGFVVPRQFMVIPNHCG